MFFQISMKKCIFIVLVFLMDVGLACLNPPELPTFRWDKYKKILSRYYRYPLRPLPFAEAERECQQHRGELVHIDSQDEWNALRVELRGTWVRTAFSPLFLTFWVGAWREPGAKTWTTKTGSFDPENSSTATWWSPEHKNSEESDETPEEKRCVFMHILTRTTKDKYGYVNENCNQSHAYICELPAGLKP